MQNFQDFDVPIIITPGGFGAAPYALHDATVYGPTFPYYWLVHSVSFWTSNSGSFPWSLYVVTDWALGNLKNAVQGIGFSTVPGYGYVPSFYGTTPATAQPPLPGIHKVGQGSGLLNDGSFGVFQAQTQPSTLNPEVGGAIPNNISKRKIILPSGWSLYVVATGNSFGGCAQFFRITYQEFKNGCRPDVWGYRTFRGAQWADVNELVSPQ